MNSTSQAGLTRRSLLRHSLLALTSGSTAFTQTRSRRPNVLFFAIDDLRPELGCYGSTYIKSPNIDRIAKRGITFQRAYCQQAVCSPSRTSLMTGARPDTTKVWDLVTHFRPALPDIATLPQHFKQHGYFVQGMGKIYHGGYDDPPTWSVPWQTPDAPVYAHPPARDNASAPKKKAKKNQKNGPPYESADVADNFYKDGKTADLAVATLRDLAKKPEPFFLAVGFSKPHLPFVAPKRYWDLYDPATIKLAANPYHPKGAPEYALSNSGELRNYQGMPADGPISDDVARRLKHGYYAATSYTDTQIGKVLDELDRLNLTGNTIIVLWGDHGWKLGEHGEWCKHSNVENDTNAPLLLAAPAMSKTAGRRTDRLVEFVDIYPTLADLAGLPLPGHLEGTSFKPLLADPNRKWKPAVFSQYPRARVMGYSMRTDRYRFTVWVDKQDRNRVDAMELYDHRNDPAEDTNIASEPGNAALIKELMEQWKKGWKGAKPPGLS